MTLRRRKISYGWRRLSLCFQLHVAVWDLQRARDVLLRRLTPIPIWCDGNINRLSPARVQSMGKYRSRLGSCKQGSLQSPDYLVDSQLRTILVASVHKGLYVVIAHGIWIRLIIHGAREYLRYLLPCLMTSPLRRSEKSRCVCVKYMEDQVDLMMVRNAAWAKDYKGITRELHTTV